MNQTTELVRRAASGDAHAFATLYSFIYKDLYRFSLYTLQNPQDAEDAVSEAVLDAFSGIGGLRDPEAFKSWMFAILSAKCKQKIRQYKNADSELSEDLAANDCSLSEQTGCTACISVSCAAGPPDPFTSSLRRLYKPGDRRAA